MSSTQHAMTVEAFGRRLSPSRTVFRRFWIALTRYSPVFELQLFPGEAFESTLAIFSSPISSAVLQEPTSFRKPSGSERACSFVENEACIYVGTLEGEEEKKMAPKMHKALLAQLKAERVKQTPGAVAPKRKSSRLQKELAVESFLDANLSNDPALDLVVEQNLEGEAEKTKRKAKGAAVEGSPQPRRQRLLLVFPFWAIIRKLSSVLLGCSVQLTKTLWQGEQMLVELAMVVTLTEANIRLTKQGATMAAELQKTTNKRDVALKSKRGLEEERDTAVATVRSLK
ncbi:hypothetical protein RHMOL_Rhmol08G0184600 [Rhododendron molle]|uniref:Uncharacterized protein n=1 Tax=Rhododendron molle TaxID=49168 RepID=A0ACC0MQ21_RHOML|nr:hypothetical protein RHMOL_Rhmol08G0184600 [Rhododendron molle]